MPKRWRLMLSLSQSTPDDDDEDGEEEETGTDRSDDGGFVSNGIPVAAVQQGNARRTLQR